MTTPRDPDRLLKRLWLVNGVALLALLVVGIGAAAVSLVSGWRDAKDVAVAAAPAAGGGSDGESRVRAVRFDVPARVRGTDTRLVLVRNGSGFTRESTAGFAGSSEPYASGGRDGPIVNVIFVPPSGAAGRLLFDRPAFVHDVSFPGERYGDTDSTQTWITYEAALDDTNGDGKLDEEDARDLFVSDLDGQHLRRVLPPEWRLEEYAPFNDGRSIAVTAVQAPPAGARRSRRDWDASRAPERAFLYDVPAGALRPFAALDSLAAQAGRLLGGAAPGR